MEQPWNQQREGGGFAMGESSCHAAADLDQAMTMTTDPCEVDGALLMELIMEDLPSDLLLDGDVHLQLSRVIWSLEAEIGAGSGQQAAAMMADEGGEAGLGRIEGVLSDDMDDGYDYEGASSSSFLVGHDEAEGWCVYTNGYESGSVLGYDAMVDHQYYYCSAEGSAEHMYLPLWE